MNVPYNKFTILKSAGILIGGIFLGWLLFGGTSNSPSIDEHIERTHTNEQGEIVYTCSMHPNIRQNEPGNCPICGMELIPVNSLDSGTDQKSQALTMTKAAMKIADVRTIEAVKKPAVKTVRMPGKVAVDERNISIIPAHFPGRVEELFLNFTGAYVEKGDKLATVYSPELITAQRELLEAYKVKESNPRLYESARQKLINWKISPAVIDRIIREGRPLQNFDIHAHQNGYVLKRHVSVGDHLHFGKAIFEIADLSRVWIKFDAYESDLKGLSEGDNVTFSVAAYPGQTFESKITFIDPLIHEGQRTVSVRTEFKNNKGKLKPNMLAEGTVSSTLNNGQPTLQIPKQAVMWTGERSIVYVKLPDSTQTRFEAREVVLGARIGDYYIIKSGLSEGEEVVMKGNFMIDSAAQLADKISMMNRPEQPETATINMSGSSNKTQNAQVDTTQNKTNTLLSALVDHYLSIKNALTTDELEKAKNNLQLFQKELAKSFVKKDSSAMEKERLAALNQAIKKARGSENLKQFRSAFSEISSNLIKAVEEQGYDSGQLFSHYCPMAESGKGAYWVSKSRETVNPYMGQKMPGCGQSTKKVSSDN